MHARPFPHLSRDRGRGSWPVGGRRPALVHLAAGELDDRDGAGREGGRQDRAFLTRSLALTDAVPPRRTVLDEALPVRRRESRICLLPSASGSAANDHTNRRRIVSIARVVHL